MSNATQVNAFGNGANAGGQRSDVTMVARFDPAAKTVTVLSIPRDLWVDIPGNVSGISGMNRINAAFDSGPDLLVQTIEKDLGIPINHYMSVDFPGSRAWWTRWAASPWTSRPRSRTPYTGLDVTTTGCQTVNGTTALQLVRSRHLSYMNSNGYWEGDGLSDFSRIQRQDAFFRAVLAKVNQSSLNPFTVNSFIGAAVGNLTIDDTLSKSDLLNLAQDFRSTPASHLVTETLPTLGFVTYGGADVLKEAEPYAQNMIDAFNRIGTAPAPTPATHTRTSAPTTVPTEPAHLVDVNVMNASAVNGIAHTTAAALTAHGFNVAQVTDAPSPLVTGSPSEIRYGPAGLGAADTLASVLRRPRHPGAGPKPDRPDRVVVDRRIAADRDRDAADGRRRDDDDDDHTRADDNDDNPLECLRQHPARTVEPVPLQPGPDDAGVAQDDDDSEEVGVVGPAQADLRRCRTIRLRSRSVMPPQTPSRSRWARACSRHAWRTGQTAHTALASAASASSSVTG